MSHFIILCPENDGARFNLTELLDALNSLNGVRDVHEDSVVPGMIQGVYEYCDDATIIDIRTDGTRIAIEGTGIAALNCAFELSRGLNVSVRAFDSSYTFDFKMSDFVSVDDFAKRLESG